MKRNVPEIMQDEESIGRSFARTSIHSESEESISLNEFNQFRESLNRTLQNQNVSALTTLGILRASRPPEEKRCGSSPTPPLLEALQLIKEDMSGDEDCESETSFSLR